jgi:hypothetical protein
MKHVTLIRRKASVEALPKYKEQIDPNRFKYKGEYRSIDYLLVRPMSSKPRKIIDNFRLVRSSGKWFLYRRFKVKSSHPKDVAKRFSVDPPPNASSCCMTEKLFYRVQME